MFRKLTILTEGLRGACARKYFLLLLTTILIAAGCKKGGDDGSNGGDADGSEFYIRFKADGTELEYKSNAITQVLAVSPKGLYSCALQGYNDFTMTDNGLMSLIIWSEDPITATTYRNADNVSNSDGDKIPSVVVTFLDDKKVSYLSQGVPLARIPPLDKIVSDVQVTLTEVSQSRIAGNFSGTLFKTTDGAFSTTVKITDGKFNLRRL